LNNMSGIKRVRCPVLIVHGTHDSVVPYQVCLRCSCNSAHAAVLRVLLILCQCGLDLFEARCKVRLPQVSYWTAGNISEFVMTTLRKIQFNRCSTTIHPHFLVFFCAVHRCSCCRRFWFLHRHFCIAVAHVHHLRSRSQQPVG
jgi:hypothetical protein